MSWEIIDSGISTAAQNMQLDSHLLLSLNQQSRPILHFYDWKHESATFGYFIKPQDYLDLEKVKKKGLDLARRPTGGGIVFHIWDFAFSVLVPTHFSQFSENTLENYAFVNEAVNEAMKQVLKGKVDFELIKRDALALDVHCKNFCMARPTKYDLVFEGKKIAGAAQRKTKMGFLHQGTISIMQPSQHYLEDLLLPSTKVLEAMITNTFFLLPSEASLQQLKEVRKLIQNQLQHTLEKHV